MNYNHVIQKNVNYFSTRFDQQNKNAGQYLNFSLNYVVIFTQEKNRKIDMKKKKKNLIHTIVSKRLTANPLP